jgi:dihydroorotate dehydrogenase (NAD+) catalytic subunit
LNLRVQLGRLTLPNPVLVASGTFGYAREMEAYVRLDRLGGIVPKTVTIRPRAGNPPPRTVETPSGMLNSIGLDNDGLDYFLREHLPVLRELGPPILVNIAGRNDDEFIEMAERVGRAGGAAAIELNLSCPNVSGGTDFGTDPERTARVVRGVCDAVSLPVIAKLTPNVTDVVPIAQAAADAGADAVSLVNTLLALAVDWRRRRPVLGNTVGGLSGPAIKPVALRMVWQVATRVDVPVIGIGGITTLDDVLEFLVAGARAVQIGTANFFDPSVSERLVDQLPRVLADEGLDDVNQLIGSLQPAVPAPGAAAAISTLD